MNLDAIAADRQTLALDGCDGVGKSTLAAHLSDKYGFTVVHSPRTPDHQDLTSRYRTLLNQPGKLLLDRCFISELVYGPLFRGRSRITHAQAIDLAETLATRQGLFIHLTSPPAIVHGHAVIRVSGHCTSLWADSSSPCAV
ncbi:hypothetical protein [Streptomyces syringium]|uniref:Thymidylate kinase n=1 Tax=Streptomyces syringium TaxID=76729 RepID=A0ABS4XW43_9ACTN|nr:hypothetical protein [Streptomyces syringium]MBP2400728.1 thymidylate kinase [Streptomyces syringium]